MRRLTEWRGGKMDEMVNVNLTLPKKAVEYIDREAEENYLSRASVARKYLLDEIDEEMVLETRLKGYSIRKTAEITGVPYKKVLRILGKTQVDDE